MTTKQICSKFSRGYENGYADGMIDGYNETIHAVTLANRDEQAYQLAYLFGKLDGYKKAHIQVMDAATTKTNS